MTGNDQWHGIGGVCAAHSACGARVANLVGDIAICAGLTVRDGEDNLQYLNLEGAQQGPIDRQMEGFSFTSQVFIQLLKRGGYFFGVGLNWSFETSNQVGAKVRFIL